jgi:DNA-binding winged helix-turn-helix (wHTH) protein
VIYQFENFSLDAERRELRQGTSIVPIEPQVFDLFNISSARANAL